MGGPVNVMTWTVQHASASRSREQAAWLAEATAGASVQVVVLTETSRTEGVLGRPGALAVALAAHGFSTHAPAAGGDYGVLLAVRGTALEPVLELRADHLPHRCAISRVRLEDGTALGVVGLYVPSRGPQERRNVDKRAFQAAVTRLLPSLTALAGEGPVIVAGDLNVVEPGHVPAHRVFGGWEYDFYRSFAGTGFEDVFRQVNPDAVDHSWFGRRSGLGYRFDHLFCSRAHLPAVTGCRYDHEPLRRGLSDHSALRATVTVGADPNVGVRLGMGTDLDPNGHVDVTRHATPAARAELAAPAPAG